MTSHGRSPFGKKVAAARRASSPGDGSGRGRNGLDFLSIKQRSFQTSSSSESNDDSLMQYTDSKDAILDVPLIQLCLLSEPLPVTVSGRAHFLGVCEHWKYSVATGASNRGCLLISQLRFESRHRYVVKR